MLPVATAGCHKRWTVYHLEAHPSHVGFLEAGYQQLSAIQSRGCWEERLEMASHAREFCLWFSAAGIPWKKVTNPLCPVPRHYSNWVRQDFFFFFSNSVSFRRVRNKP